MPQKKRKHHGYDDDRSFKRTKCERLWETKPAAACRLRGTSKGEALALCDAWKIMCENSGVVPVHVELLRSDAVLAVRERYAELCSHKLGMRFPPKESFNRWFCERRLLRDHVDAFLPSSPTDEATDVSPSMLREISEDIPVKLRWPRSDADIRRNIDIYVEACEQCLRGCQGCPEDMRTRVDEAIAVARTSTAPPADVLKCLKASAGATLQELKRDVIVDVCREVMAFSRAKAAWIEDNAQVGGRVEIELRDRSAGVTSLQIDDGKDTREMVLNTSHVDKLEDAFLRGGGSQRDFKDRLASLLLRYESIFGKGHAGYGLHAAVPPRTFAALNELIGVEFEVFASPLNCYFPNFCSVFPDTDAPFGSCGSFFDFLPTEGSFEANPPFSEELMVAMVDHMERLLKEAPGPMSFCVFVPDWWDPPTEGLVRMVGHEERLPSPFHRFDFVAEKFGHQYVSGSQHEGTCRRRLYKAVHGTRVIMLQNDAGYAKWPLTEEKLERLKEAMRP